MSKSKDPTKKNWAQMEEDEGSTSATEPEEGAEAAQKQTRWADYDSEDELDKPILDLGIVGSKEQDQKTQREGNCGDEWEVVSGNKKKTKPPSEKRRPEAKAMSRAQVATQSKAASSSSSVQAEPRAVASRSTGSSAPSNRRPRDERSTGRLDGTGKGLYLASRQDSVSGGGDEPKSLRDKQAQQQAERPISKEQWPQRSDRPQRRDPDEQPELAKDQREAKDPATSRDENERAFGSKGSSAEPTKGCPQGVYPRQDCRRGGGKGGGGGAGGGHRRGESSADDWLARRMAA